MKVQKEIRFQPVIIMLEKEDEVEKFLKMCDVCSESLGEDSFSQFCRNLRGKGREAICARKV